jgi:hypothetical protein
MGKPLIQHGQRHAVRHATSRAGLPRDGMRDSGTGRDSGLLLPRFHWPDLGPVRFGVPLKLGLHAPLDCRPRDHWLTVSADVMQDPGPLQPANLRPGLGNSGAWGESSPGIWIHAATGRVVRRGSRDRLKASSAAPRPCCPACRPGAGPGLHGEPARDTGGRRTPQESPSARQSVSRHDASNLPSVRGAEAPAIRVAAA